MPRASRSGEKKKLSRRAVREQISADPRCMSTWTMNAGIARDARQGRALARRQSLQRKSSLTATA
jgi:hypothetical protein